MIYFLRPSAISICEYLREMFFLNFLTQVQIFPKTTPLLTHIAGIMELSTCKRVDVFLRRSLWVPHKFFSSYQRRFYIQCCQDLIEFLFRFRTLSYFYPCTIIACGSRGYHNLRFHYPYQLVPFVTNIFFLELILC